MGKIKPSTLCSFDVKPLIPNNKDKFSRPPKEEKVQTQTQIQPTQSQVGEKKQAHNSLHGLARLYCKEGA